MQPYKSEKKEKILLSIALLASNRKDTIQKCLDSLTPIREAISCELIILDTGCDADVREILDAYGDTVAEFTWMNDFSAARNETLKYAHGEWYMYLDDDEWFVDAKEMIDFFTSGNYKKFGYASYIQRNFLDMDATQYTDAWVSRMSRRSQDLHFESKIHEYMAPMDGDCIGLKAIVHHFGYAYETQEKLWAHYERNRVLLLEMIEAEPDNLRWRSQLAQEYRSVKENGLLYALGEESLKLTKNLTDRYSVTSIGGFYAAKILALKEEKRYEEMLQVCGEADADVRMTRLCRTFTALRAADACFYLGRFTECEAHAKRYIGELQFWEDNEPLLFLQKAVPFVGECLDLVMIKECYSLLICAGLKQGNTEYLKQYLSKLAWDEDSLYVHEEIVQTMVEAMCRLPREPIFEQLIRVMYAHRPLWEYVCDCLCAYEQAGNRVTQMMDLIRDAAPEALMSEQEAQAKEELRKMKAQVLEQVRMLAEAGQVEQARQVMEELKKIMPDDAF